MAKKKSTSPLVRAIRLNAKRRVEKYAEFKKAGAKWMMECRDLWDSEDEDAGVYFVDCASENVVRRRAREMDPMSDRILGIYDLSKPLAKQGPGLTLEEWKARREK